MASNHTELPKFIKMKAIGQSMDRNVGLIRLISGEEVVAVTKNDLALGMEISRPMQVVIRQTPNGAGLQLHPFMALAEQDTLVLNVDTVVTWTILAKDNQLRTEYLKNVWNEPAIAVPDKKIVLPN